MLFNVSFDEKNMHLNVSFNQKSMRLDADFAQSFQKLEVDFSGLQRITEYKDVDPYTGSYEVSPKVDAQTLPTAQKMMAEDLTVKAIPVFDVSNNSGGRTVYIAREV